MNWLYGQSRRKDTEEKDIRRSENWLLRNNDEGNVEKEALPSDAYGTKYRRILVLIK